MEQRCFGRLIDWLIQFTTYDVVEQWCFGRLIDWLTQFTTYNVVEQWCFGRLIDWLTQFTAYDVVEQWCFGWLIDWLVQFTAYDVVEQWCFGRLIDWLGAIWCLVIVMRLIGWLSANVATFLSSCWCMSDLIGFRWSKCSRIPGRWRISKIAAVSFECDGTFRGRNSAFLHLVLFPWMFRCGSSLSHSAGHFFWKDRLLPIFHNHNATSSTHTHTHTIHQSFFWCFFRTDFLPLEHSTIAAKSFDSHILPSFRTIFVVALFFGGNGSIWWSFSYGLFAKAKFFFGFNFI